MKSGRPRGERITCRVTAHRSHGVVGIQPHHPGVHGERVDDVADGPEMDKMVNIRCREVHVGTAKTQSLMLYSQG